jgi:hypothetical protein
MLFLIIFVLGIVSGWTGIWWMIALASFIPALFYRLEAKRTFLSGFLAIFLAWAGDALIRSVMNHHILASRVAHLLFVGNWWCLALLTGVLGGLVAGMSALCGRAVRNAFIFPSLTSSY